MKDRDAMRALDELVNGIDPWEAAQRERQKCERRLRRHDRFAAVLGIISVSLALVQLTILIMRVVSR